MTEAPFVPKLHTDNPVPRNPFYWTDSEIWLHKQPVFLWQMALSIKLLGSSLLAVRLPSIIMQLVMSWLIFRIARNLGEPSTVSLIAASFFLASRYMIEMSVGVVGMDHNDVAYSFYFLLCYWLLSHYIQTNGIKNAWLIAIGIGVFCGLAVMNKWLIAWVVFGSWFIWIIWKGKSWNARKRHLLYLILSFIVHLIVMLPWQIYVSRSFPEHYQAAQEFNVRHISEALEGHTGNWLYYITIMPYQYSFLVLGVLSIGSILFFKHLFKKAHFVILVFPVIVYYLFFSVIVETKSYNYVSYLQPMVFIIAAIFLYKLDAWLSTRISLYKKGVFALISIIIIVDLNDPIAMYQYHVEDEGQYLFNMEDRKQKRHNTAVYSSLSGKFGEMDLVFNLPEFENIDCMFFSGGNSYSGIPTPEIRDSLINQGYTLYYFGDSKDQIDDEEFQAKMHLLDYELR